MTVKSLLAGSALVALAAGAQATEYRSTTWLPASNVVTDVLMTQWAANVAEATGGEISFQLFPAAALVPASAIFQGVADGIAQVGYHSAAYSPSDQPLSQALSGMGFYNPDPYVLTFAYTDYVMNDPDGYMDWHDDGVVPVGGYASPVTNLICKGDPIRTLEDLRGKRIRLPGGSIAAFVEEMGATNVSITVTETYSAFEYGNIDCTANDPTWLGETGRFAEVANSITMVPITPIFSSPAWIYDNEFWAGLTADQRRILLEQTAHSMAELQARYDRDRAAGLEYGAANGVEIVEPDESILGFLDEWLAAGAGDMAGNVQRNFGVEDPEALFATFRGYMDKWDALMDTVEDRQDVAAVQALLMENLYDKIDVETYGLD